MESQDYMVSLLTCFRMAEKQTESVLEAGNQEKCCPVLNVLISTILKWHISVQVLWLKIENFTGYAI